MAGIARFRSDDIALHRGIPARGAKMLDRLGCISSALEIARRPHCERVRLVRVGDINGRAELIRINALGEIDLGEFTALVGGALIGRLPGDRARLHFGRIGRVLARLPVGGDIEPREHGPHIDRALGVFALSIERRAGVVGDPEGDRRGCSDDLRIDYVKLQAFAREIRILSRDALGPGRPLLARVSVRAGRSFGAVGPSRSVHPHGTRGTCAAQRRDGKKKS
ncbi:MAG: hypothetical protein L6Q76_08440 [Polyangiaceae bacterium]|nr:hypothetical protein [Polyangiaceae bacterium]